MPHEATNGPQAGPACAGWQRPDLLGKPYEDLNTGDLLALVNYWQAWPAYYWHEKLVTGGTTHVEGLSWATQVLALAAEGRDLDSAAIIEAADLLRRYVTDPRLARYYSGTVGSMPVTATDWIQKSPLKHRSSDADLARIVDAIGVLGRLHRKLNLFTDGGATKGA
jgi:hypothetical protein